MPANLALLLCSHHCSRDNLCQHCTCTTIMTHWNTNLGRTIWINRLSSHEGKFATLFKALWESQSPGDPSSIGPRIIFSSVARLLCNIYVVPVVCCTCSETDIKWSPWNKFLKKNSSKFLSISIVFVALVEKDRWICFEESQLKFFCLPHSQLPLVSSYSPTIASALGGAAS